LQRRLDAKLAALEAIHREVQLLQAELNYRPQLVVHVKMIDVSLTKLAYLGEEWKDLLEGPKPEQSPGVETFGLVDPARFDELIAKGLARVMASPTVVTVLGRRAEFHQGGETPWKTADEMVTNRRFGTHLELLGTQIGEDRFELKLSAEHGELDRLNPIEIDGQKHPGVRMSKVDTSAVLKSGETLMLPGPIRVGMDVTQYTDGRTVRQENRIQSLMLVTVELVEAPSFTDAPQVNTTNAGEAQQVAPSPDPSTATQTTLRK
jgi:hypothetical protein